MNTTMKQFETFSRSLKFYGIDTERKMIDKLMINMGKKNEQGCSDCNNGTSSEKTEEMSKNTVDRIINLLSNSNHIKEINITGDSPDKNTHINYLISRLGQLDLNITIFCNLSALTDIDSIVDFLAKNKVNIICSIPEPNIDYEAGIDNHYFSEVSISTLELLNQYGYGQKDSSLKLDLYFRNDFSKHLPVLEADYKNKFMNDYGISFHHLYMEVKMPINQFAGRLMENGEFTNYCNHLFAAFDPEAASKIACMHQLVINWNGDIFDCEHNLSLDIPVYSENNTIWNIDNIEEVTKEITFARHCYGCTAGCKNHCRYITD